MKCIPNWLLYILGTLTWRIERMRNTFWPEIKRRWPVVFIDTWRGRVAVKAK